MTSEQFVIWLQGYIAGCDKPFNAKEMKAVNDKIKTVTQSAPIMYPYYPNYPNTITHPYFTCTDSGGVESVTSNSTTTRQ